MTINKSIYPLIIILNFIFSCQQKSVKKNIESIEETSSESFPTFLIYGELSPNDYVKEKDSLITQKFGFYLKRVAYCEVKEELIDSVKTINQKNNLIMKSKYGNNWKKEFETASKLKLEIPETE